MSEEQKSETLVLKIFPRPTNKMLLIGPADKLPFVIWAFAQIKTRIPEKEYTTNRIFYGIVYTLLCSNELCDSDTLISEMHNIIIGNDENHLKTSLVSQMSSRRIALQIPPPRDPTFVTEVGRSFGFTDEELSSMEACSSKEIIERETNYQKQYVEINHIIAACRAEYAARVKEYSELLDKAAESLATA